MVQALSGSGERFTVGPYLNNETIIHPEDVYAAKMGYTAIGALPGQLPVHDAALAQAEYLFNLEVGRRILAKVVLPELGYGSMAHIDSAVRGWLEVLNRAVIAHKLHQAGYIMAIEGVVERQGDAHGGLHLGHPDRAHWLDLGWNRNDGHYFA